MKQRVDALDVLAATEEFRGVAERLCDSAQVVCRHGLHAVLCFAQVALADATLLCKFGLRKTTGLSGNGQELRVQRGRRYALPPVPSSGTFIVERTAGRAAASSSKVAGRTTTSPRAGISMCHMYRCRLVQTSATKKLDIASEFVEAVTGHEIGRRGHPFQRQLILPEPRLFGVVAAEAVAIGELAEAHNTSPKKSRTISS